MALALTAVSEFMSTPYWLHIKPEWIGKQTPVSTMHGISMLRDRSKTSSQTHAARFVFKLAFYSWHGCPVKILSGVGVFELTPLFNLIKQRPRDPMRSSGSQPALRIGYPTFSHTEHDKLQYPAGGTDRLGHSGHGHNRLPEEPCPSFWIWVSVIDHLDHDDCNVPRWDI
jgi:hypothetical protein